MPGRFNRDADRRATDARSKAEAALRKVTTKPIDEPAGKPAIPAAREMISIRIDHDGLGHFQPMGRVGWTASMQRCGGRRTIAEAALSI